MPNIIRCTKKVWKPEVILLNTYLLFCISIRLDRETKIAIIGL